MCNELNASGCKMYLCEMFAPKTDILQRVIIGLGGSRLYIGSLTRCEVMKYLYIIGQFVLHGFQQLLLVGACDKRNSNILGTFIPVP